MDSLSSSFHSTRTHRNSLLSTTTVIKHSGRPTNLTISSFRNEKNTTTCQPKKTIRTKLVPSSSKPQPSLLVTILNAFDYVINNYIDPPLKAWLDPKHVLSGNFAPIDELPPTECEIIFGKLPRCLDGTYIRNGPNPQHFPRGPYHLFDGDGMLNSIRISKGRATFCSRYVKTYRFTIEHHAGSPILPKVFSGFNGLPACVSRGLLAYLRFLAGQFDLSNGTGLANTSLSYIGGKLYALGESDLPYEINITQNGDVLTLNREDFGKSLSRSMTAHPKIDPDTGETFAFRYGPVHPYLTFFRFDKTGRKQPDVPILTLKKPSFIHDFAITKKYAIFCDIQIGMNPLVKIIKGESPVGADPLKVPRIGVIPRYAKDESEMRWFDVPGFNIVHAINAWDEDDGNTVVMVAPNISPVEHTLDRLELTRASIEKVRIDLKSGTVSRFSLSTTNLEFAVINPAFISKKNKYVYAAVGDPLPKVTGVVKLDVSVSEGDCSECVVASRIYGPGCYGGEPFFVHRDSKDHHLKEDDGYIVSYVHNEHTGESNFIVMDAMSPNLEIVAAVKLPRRVPYGFHGLFVGENVMNKL